MRECRYGLMLYNINDAYIGHSLEHYGEFSDREAEVFRRAVRAGDIVVDVGANVGAHTLFFAKAVGREGKVYAFEPQRLTFQILCANMALNDITNAYCFQTAVGEHPGSIVVPALNPEVRQNFGRVELGEPTQGETVERTTIDSLTLPHCRLMKVDVEGMELSVLKGARRTIEQYRPFLYLENDRVEKSQSLIQYVHRLGYDMYWDLPLLYNANNYYQNPINIFGETRSCNLLCIHSSLKVVIEGSTQVLPGDRHPQEYL
jgi:FkbM family methyltransferase